MGAWLWGVASYARIAWPDSGATGDTAVASTGGSFVWTADCDTRVDPDDTAPEHDSDVDSAVDPEMDTAAADSGDTGLVKPVACGCSGPVGGSGWALVVLAGSWRRHRSGRGPSVQSEIFSVRVSRNRASR